MSDRFKYVHPVIEDYKSEFIKTLATDVKCEYIIPSDLVELANILEVEHTELKAEKLRLNQLLKLVWDVNKPDLDERVRVAIRDYYDSRQGE